MPTRSAWMAVGSIALGTFILVTNEFLPVGLLGSIARDLHVATAMAGTMVTATAVTAAVAAPVLTVIAGRLDRRAFLIGMTALFITADLLAAATDNYTVMLIARVLLGLGIGGFWAIGGSLGARLVAPVQAPRATAIIFSGISLATVIGVPAGVAIGTALGWRTAFLATAALGVLALLLQALLLPPLGIDAPHRIRAMTALLANPTARFGLIITVLLVTGQFIGYTFISPFLLSTSGISSANLSALLLLFGVAGLVGNALVPRLARRHLVSTIAISATLIALSAAYLGTTHGRLAPALAVMAWGFAYGTVPAALQTWILHADPTGFEMGSALYIASFQAAIALGASVGAITDNLGGPPAALLAGALLAATAAAVFSHRAQRSETEHAASRPSRHPSSPDRNLT